MYQVAFINNENYFDVKFVEDAEVKDYVKGLYKEQICSIAKNYVRQELDEFEFMEGDWGRVLTVNGELVATSSAYELEGVGWIKQSDLPNYKKCDVCGKYHNKSRLHKIKDLSTGEVKEVCDDCKSGMEVFICGHCGGMYVNGMFTERVSGRLVCDECANGSDVEICEGCGERFFRGDMHYDIDDRLVCSRCDEYDDGDDYIEDYHHDRSLSSCYVPGESAKDKEKKIGIELEIGKGPDTDNVLAKYCIDQMDGKLHCKYDGSIHGYGFEMVTNPMSYKYYETTMPAWSNILSKCEKRGFHSDASANTGMHIHINRPWFGDPTVREANIDRMLYLFEGFWDNILKFANRSASKAGEWAKRYASSGTKKYKKEDIKRCSTMGDRYRAVNLCNSGTVEIRIFNGTLDEKQFFANVQLVKRLMDIVTTYTEDEFYELTWNDVVNGDEQYTYLIERGNGHMGPEPNVKLKERFEDMDEVSEKTWKEFPIGTKVHINIREAVDYSCGVADEMYDYNDAWVTLDESVERERFNDDVLYIIDGCYYCLEMFDDYRLPEGCNLTVDIPYPRYLRDDAVTASMYAHHGETIAVASHTDEGIKLGNLRKLYKADMFKELKYINSRIGS